MNRIHLAYVLFHHVGLIVDASQRSAQFHAVQSAGLPMCSVDLPLVAQRARSKGECSLQCLALSDDGCCVAFNFKQDTPSCELFETVTRNFMNVKACSLYQV